MTKRLERREVLFVLMLAVAVATSGAGRAAAQEGAADTTGSEAESLPDSVSAVEEEAAAEPVRATTAASSTTGLSVLRAYVCKGIEQSEPTEAGKSFVPASDGVLRLCTFSEIGGPARPDSVLHVWYWGEREMARVPLRVQGPRWRTWSTKQILDEWRGEWHVDITDREGALLSRLDFSVE
jgi:hypothetical protein